MGGMKMEIVKSVDWLKENLENDSVRIIDCRFDLTNPDNGTTGIKKVIFRIVLIFTWKMISPI